MADPTASPAPNAATALPVLTLTRGTDTFSYNGATGRKGTLEIKGQTFVSMERMDGYVCLKPGSYDAILERKGDQTSGAEAIFVYHNIYTAAGKKAEIFIHAARYPQHLEGCIAPGRSSDAKGVLQSAEALNDIFALIAGKWVRWTKLRLEVVGDMY